MSTSGSSCSPASPWRRWERHPSCRWQEVSRKERPGSLCRVPERRRFDRSRSMVGEIAKRKGSRVMRKLSLLILGAAGRRRRCHDGVADHVAVFDERGRSVCRHVSAAQPFRRRFRENPYGLCREAGGIQADRIGDQRHADLARSSFELHGRQELPRHAGPDPRRIRRPRHRGHDGGRPRQGRHPHRRYARLARRHPRQRRDHPDQRRSGSGPQPQPGRRQDARPDQLRRSPSKSSARKPRTRSRSSSPAR